MYKQCNQSFDYIRIRQIRELRNFSQKTVAEQLGISQSSYNDIEQGNTKLRVEFLPLLARHLQVDIRCFFENELSCTDQLSVLNENKELEDTCTELRLEIERLGTRLEEERQIYSGYQEKCNELLEVLRYRLRQKKFYIAILLLYVVLSLFMHIFITYFDELYTLMAYEKR